MTVCVCLCRVTSGASSEEPQEPAASWGGEGCEALRWRRQEGCMLAWGSWEEGSCATTKRLGVRAQRWFKTCVFPSVVGRGLLGNHAGTCACMAEEEPCRRGECIAMDANGM